MLAVGPLGPQYSLLFAWHELGRQATLGVDTLPSQSVPQKILKKSISLYSIRSFVSLHRLHHPQFNHQDHCRGNESPKTKGC